MRKFTILLACCLLALPALAAQTYTYDWEHADVDYLGCFHTDMLADVASYANRPGSAGHGLVLTKNNTASAGYALGFLAAVWDLEPGDQVTASVWRYDPMAGLPYFRLWAHANNALVNAGSAMGQDMEAYDGNLMGNSSFGSQIGWEQFSHTWTIGAGTTGMVIDAVVYGSPGDVIWVDDLSVTVPDHASVRLPDAFYPAGGPPVAVDASTWSQVKTLFR
jgi:hypothetical protein